MTLAHLGTGAVIGTRRYRTVIRFGEGLVAAGAHAALNTFIAMKCCAPQCRAQRGVGEIGAAAER